MALREEKKERTREALRAAAFRLFGEKGFEATTVDEIAATAGVSRTTFFRYFPTKESVVFGRGQEIGEVFRSWIAERPEEENAFQAFEGAILALARATAGEAEIAAQSLALEALLEANPELRKRHGEQMQEQMVLIADALAEREGVPVGVPHRLVAGIALVVSQAAREQWHASGATSDPELLLKDLFATVRSLTGAGGT